MQINKLLHASAALILLLSSSAWAGPVVEIKTSQGAFQVELNPEKAPNTVANFLQYTKDGFYSGTIFHRVISNFMIQGGGMDKDLNEKKTRDPIRNEADNGLRNDEGTIAMARTMEPHSASSQFFININDNRARHFALRFRQFFLRAFVIVKISFAPVESLKTKRAEFRRFLHIKRCADLIIVIGGWRYGGLLRR